MERKRKLNIGKQGPGKKKNAEGKRKLQGGGGVAS